LGISRLAGEELRMDLPLLYPMRSQVVSMHLVDSLAGGVYAKRMKHHLVQTNGLLKEIKVCIMQIQADLNGGRDKIKRLTGMGVEGVTLVVVHENVEYQTMAAAAAVSARMIIKRGKNQIRVKKVGGTRREKLKSPLTEEITEGWKVACASASKF